MGVKPSAHRVSGGWVSMARSYEFVEQLSCSLHSGGLQQNPPACKTLESRPFPLPPAAGIRKTPSTRPFEKPTNTRVGLSLIRHTEIS